MSLGYRHGHDHIAERAPPRVPIAPVLPETSTGACKKRSLLSRVTCSMCAPRGFLPTFMYASLFFVLPMVYNYVDDIDYADTTTRGVVIGLSAVTATVSVYANDCCCWYNLFLFLHTALEVKVVDVAIAYAYADGTSDRDMALSIAGAAVVVLHLAPFFLLDHRFLLAVLAYAGVIVNASILVFLEPALLLVVGISSSALLIVTLVVAGVCEVHTSILGVLRAAISEKKLVRMGTMEL